MREIDVNKLYEFAGDQAVQLEEALHCFAGILRQNYELRFFLENPMVTVASKIAALEEVCAEAFPLMIELVEMLIKEGKARLIISLADNFSKLMGEKEGLNYVEVKSAYPLDEQAKGSIGRFAGGKSILREVLSPELIGGITVLTGDGRYFDGSLKGRLENLKGKLSYA